MMELHLDVGGGARGGAGTGVTIAICFRCPLISQSSANEQAHPVVGLMCLLFAQLLFWCLYIFGFFFSCLPSIRLMREQGLSLRSFVVGGGGRFGTLLPDVF